MLAADDQPIDERVHVADLRFVQLGRLREIERRAVDDHPAHPLLAQVGEDDVEILAVDLEDRCAQLDLGSLGQREDRFENLAR